MNNNDGLNVPYAQSKPRRSSSAMEHYSDIDYLRSPSRAGDAYLTPASVSRSGTLKKRGSMRQGGGNNGLRRKESTKSISRGGGTGNTDRETFNSAFFTPVPTSGLPTDRLVDRFSAWRKYLKDLVTYYHEVQVSYEQRSKATLKVANVINNITVPPNTFLLENGILEGPKILQDHHKQAILEANKAREIEDEIVAKLSNLRHDLGQKIKEIKSLSGDFKNSVDKEMEHTRRAVGALETAESVYDSNPAAITGKGDPYVLRLGVERQIEKQLDEENYLHRAFLNLEGSGRELESIVVGEIQKSYSAFAGILRREADDAIITSERLRDGPISMVKDLEWSTFVNNEPNLINPNVPIRRAEKIEYPGKHHPAAAEVRAGMLERKSKYLKSYTPGWYILSTTHLHEFKSADRIHTQTPVISLALHDQKLGSHSQLGSSSSKFILKGRQTGAVHRGHSWVFRAESHDTMMAWYDDIKSLTEKSGEEKRAFVRRHARSHSTGSQMAPSFSSDGLDEDEADKVPYSAGAALLGQNGRTLTMTTNVSASTAAPTDSTVAAAAAATATATATAAEEKATGATGTTTTLPPNRIDTQTAGEPQTPKRPSPGGRFPSDVNVGMNRDLRARRLSSSGGSSDDTGGAGRDVSSGGRGAAKGASAAGDEMNGTGGASGSVAGSGEVGEVGDATLNGHDARNGMNGQYLAPGEKR